MTNIVFQFLSGNLNGFVQQLSEMVQRDSKQTNFETVLTDYVGRLFQRSVVSSTGVLGSYVKETIQSDAAAAFRTVSAYMVVPQVQGLDNRFLLKWLDASYVANSLRHPTKTKEDAGDQVTGSTLTNWSSRFTQLDVEQEARIAKQGEITNRLLDLEQAYSTNSAKAESDHIELMQKLADNTDHEIRESSERITAIVETYKTQLSLQEPTTYWTQKRTGHRITVGVLGVAFGLVMFAGAVAVGEVWRVTAQRVLDNMEAQHSTALPNYGIFLPTVGASFLIIWVLRLISRQIVANLTLSSDASERRAMVLTFLALMQKPEHVTEPDRILILSALFRPASRSDDDGAPPSWFDLVMQRIKPGP